jgi:hypothetical protein
MAKTVAYSRALAVHSPDSLFIADSFEIHRPSLYLLINSGALEHPQRRSTAAMTTDVPAPQAADTPEAASAPNGIRRYEVVAVQVPIVFNREGDHDHNGMIYALDKNKSELDEIRRNFTAHAKEPHPLVRPLVLRVRCGETVEVRFTNHIWGRCVGMHLVGDGYDVITSDGAAVGANPSSLAGPPYEEWETPDPQPRNERTYSWYCGHEGVFPFHDMGNLSGGEEGTNVHGLFGTLVVEPPEAEWTDPRTGERLDSSQCLECCGFGFSAVSRASIVR